MLGFHGEVYVSYVLLGVGYAMLSCSDHQPNKINLAYWERTSIVDGSIVQLIGKQLFLLNPTGNCCCIVMMVIELDHGVIRLPSRSNR
jgi:hypothetical protein